MRPHKFELIGSTAWLAAAVALLAVGCDKSAPPAPEAPPATSSAEAVAACELDGEARGGSSALQPLVNAAKDEVAETSNKATPASEVSAGGSKKGLADVAAGAVQIGNSDIFAPDDLKAQLVDHKVAVVGFAAMANKGPFNEKIPAISLADMAKIFSGTVTTDVEDGGGRARYDRCVHQPRAGLRHPLGVRHHRARGRQVRRVADRGQLGRAGRSKLKQTKGAISYLALSFADPELRTFAIKGDAGVVEPGPDSITTGGYPIWSYEHMYTKGEPGGSAKQFLDYLASSDFQEHVLPTVKGFIPITQMKVSRE